MKVGSRLVLRENSAAISSKTSSLQQQSPYVLPRVGGGMYYDTASGSPLFLDISIQSCWFLEQFSLKVVSDTGTDGSSFILSKADMNSSIVFSGNHADVAPAIATAPSSIIPLESHFNVVPGQALNVSILVVDDFGQHLRDLQFYPIIILQFLQKMRKIESWVLFSL